jgi:ankyrin repeat protein
MSDMDEATERAFEACLQAITDNDVLAMRAQLVACPAVVRARDPEKRTLLLNSCFPIMRRANAEIVACLVDAGSDVRAIDYTESSALHGIVLMHTERVSQPVRRVAELLVRGGLSVDAVDGYGNTPLQKAVFQWRPAMGFDHIDCLLELGADPLHQNNYGVSPLSLARTIQGHEDLAEHIAARAS